MTDVLISANLAFRSDLARDARLSASIDRLQREDYATTSAIAESIASDWPGDLAGRLLLTTSRFVAAGYSSRDRCTELFEAMLVAMDDHGYFGEQFEQFVDEQQVACHGWVVSGLVQYWATCGDDRALTAATRVVDSLILPALEHLSTYPRTRVRLEAGEPFGSAFRVENGWRLSTDTWCVGLALNALVPLFEATRRPDLRAAITNLLTMLAEVDLVSERAQLHATLAAARNAARFSEVTGDTAALDLAVDIYRQYTQFGRTLNWETYNWFGRSDTWTEPCAIVDSIGLALSLWRQTGDIAYLHDVDIIEHSAMAFVERPDGSFGLDTIATPDFPIISPFHPDARWCCTMRGGLGLIDLRDRSYTFDGRELTVLLPRAGRVRVTDAGGNEWHLAFETDYPASGGLTIQVLEAVSGAEPLRITVARTRCTALLRPEQGPTVAFDVGVADTAVRLSTGRQLRFHGPQLVVHSAAGGLVPLSSLPRGMVEPPIAYVLDHPANAPGLRT